jgi:hypothetical protein
MLANRAARAALKGAAGCLTVSFVVRAPSGFVCLNLRALTLAITSFESKFLGFRAIGRLHVYRGVTTASNANRRNIALTWDTGID